VFVGVLLVWLSRLLSVGSRRRDSTALFMHGGGVRSEAWRCIRRRGALQVDVTVHCVVDLRPLVSR
jgi:hypothetical protein